MREYEVMVIFDPDTEERTVQPTLDRHLKVITKGGGTVDNVDIWGRRRLAYEGQLRGDQLDRGTARRQGTGPPIHDQ